MAHLLARRQQKIMAHLMVSGLPAGVGFASMVSGLPAGAGFASMVGVVALTVDQLLRWAG